MVIACGKGGPTYGKQQGDQERIQEEINQQMLAYTSTGLKVVRLKGRDPMIFARGAEEWEYLIRRRANARRPLIS